MNLVETLLNWSRSSGTNGDGVIQSITGAAIFGLAVLVFNLGVRLVRGKALFDEGSGNRNIAGYVVGWCVCFLLVPVISYELGHLTTDFVTPFLAVVSATIPTVGWLDRYGIIRRVFGGDSWYEGMILTFIAFIIAGFILLCVGGLAEQIIKGFVLL